MKYPHTRYFDFSPHADEKDVRESGIFDLQDFTAKSADFAVVAIGLARPAPVSSVLDYEMGKLRPVF